TRRRTAGRVGHETVDVDAVGDDDHPGPIHPPLDRIGAGLLCVGHDEVGVPREPGLQPVDTAGQGALARQIDVRGADAPHDGRSVEERLHRRREQVLSREVRAHDIRMCGAQRVRDPQGQNGARHGATAVHDDNGHPRRVELAPVRVAVVQCHDDRGVTGRGKTDREVHRLTLGAAAVERADEQRDPHRTLRSSARSARPMRTVEHVYTSDVESAIPSTPSQRTKSRSVTTLITRLATVICTMRRLAWSALSNRTHTMPTMCGSSCSAYNAWTWATTDASPALKAPRSNASSMIGRDATTSATVMGALSSAIQTVWVRNVLPSPAQSRSASSREKCGRSTVASANATTCKSRLTIRLPYARWATPPTPAVDAMD